MGRRSSLAALTAACVLLAGCGGGSGEAEKKPAAAPDDVATDIAPPKPTSAQTFAGQSLSENDTKRLTATMTAALRTRGQEAVPQRLRPRPHRARRPAGHLVRQRPQGADEAAPGGAGQGDRHPRLLGHGQAPGRHGLRAPDHRRGRRTTRGVVLLRLQEAGLPAAGHRRDGCRGRRVAAARSSPATTDSRGTTARWSWPRDASPSCSGPPRTRPPSADWSRASTTPWTPRSALHRAVASSSRRTCAPAGGSSCSSRRPSRDVFDYLGGEVKPLEADFLAFASPIYPDQRGHRRPRARPRGHEPHRPGPQRPGRRDLATTIRHEMVHALEHTWQDSCGDRPALGRRGRRGRPQRRPTPPSGLPPQRRDGLPARPHDPADGQGLLPRRQRHRLLPLRRGLPRLRLPGRQARGGRPARRCCGRWTTSPAAVEEALGMSEEKFVKEVRAWAS